MEYTEDRIILRRVGAVLILLGIVELIYGFVSAPQGVYNFRFFGILFGCAIAFGNLRVVSVVRWLAWFGLSCGAISLIGEILMQPAGLLLAHLRFVPSQVALYYGTQLLMLAVTLYIMRELGRPAVMEARAAAGRPRRDMRIPLVLGGLIGLALAGLQVKMLYSEDAAKALRQVATRGGPGYEYFTTTVNVQYSTKSKRVSALVQAWNDRELHEVPVQWEE